MARPRQTFKIYYDPGTLQIKGMSYDEGVMKFPFVETYKWYHSAMNLSIKRDENEVPQLKIHGLWVGSETEKVVEQRKRGAYKSPVILTKVAI